MRHAFAGLAAIVMSIAVMAPAVARGTPDGFANLVDRVMPSVVNISTGTPGPSSSGVSLGSGFVIDESGIVVTNNHVIENADRITVTFDNGEEYEATLLGADKETDLAALQIVGGTKFNAVRFGDSGGVRVGDWVMAIGQPFGLGGSVSAGIVSARNRRNITNRIYDDFIQTDAAINKGNSGGPLFDMQGRVIGVNTIIYSQSGGSVGIGFAVPSSLADSVVRQLVQFGETRRGYLGVMLEDVSETTQARLALKNRSGALVAGIAAAGGPAALAGILKDDVIVRFNGKAVNEANDLTRAVAETPVGSTVLVVVLREGQRVTLTVKLARRETRQASVQDSIDMAGLTLEPANADIKAYWGIADEVSGAVVTAVDPRSPITRELRPGDVIVEMGWDPVLSPENVKTHIARAREAGSGKPLSITVLRDGSHFRAHIQP